VIIWFCWEIEMVVPFSLVAFAPFFILLGVAVSASVISGWVAFMARETPRRRVVVRNAKIVAFPKVMPLTPKLVAVSRNVGRASAA
jgi:hypothetical protein